SRDPRASSHAPAKSEAIAFHGSNHRIPLGPAELFGAEFKTLEQVSRRKGQSGTLIDLGLVQDAEFDGVDVELPREFVHRRFRGVKTGDSAGTAHVRSAADVSLGAPKGDAQIRHTILERRALAAILVMSVKYRTRVDVIMVQRQQLAFARSTQSNPLLC